MADQIKKIVSLIFLKELKQDTNSIITITKVKVTSDLKTSIIFLSIFNNKKNNIIENEFKLIKSNLSSLRYKLGKNLAVKYVPNIKFELDDQLVFLDKINRVNKK